MGLMKRDSLFEKICAIALLAALSSCAPDFEGKGSANPSFDYLSDFSSAEVPGFHFADGYKNNVPFNCYFRRAAGDISNGVLSLSLYEETPGTYAGAEFRSHVTYGYGYYSTRLKAADCPGVITSFFLYTYYPVWDEIDIEILGKNMNEVQFNYYTDGVGGHEYAHRLGFNAAEDFHDYGFLWLPESITWYVDGIAVYQATVNLPSHPQQIMMNVWNCIGHDLWSGRFDPSRLPVKGQYEYIGYSPAN